MGQSAQSNGYYEGASGYEDPLLQVVTIGAGNSYEALDPDTGQPIPNYSFPAGYAPQSVLVAGLVNAMPQVGLAFNTTLVPQATAPPPPPPPSTVPYSYQFAQEGTQVAAGYTAVSNSTSYASLGYGWLAGSVGQGADAGSVFATDQTFAVNLPDGTYDVTPVFGDPGTSAALSTAKIVIQGAGSPVDQISTTAGQAISPTYLAVVSDGELTLRMYSSSDVYIHSLTIAPHVGPLQFQFGPAGTAPAPGSDLASNFTYYTAQLGYGWSAVPHNDQNVLGGSPTAIYASDQTFSVNLPNGSYILTLTLAGTGGAGDTVTATVDGTREAALATTSGPVTATYLAVVSGNTMTLELAGGGPSDRAAIESLVIASLDFQSNSSSPEASAGVTPLYFYDSSVSADGYGFSSSSAHLNGAPGAVTASDMTFLVNLPDGYYDVMPTIGGGESGVEVFLQGSSSYTDMITSASTPFTQTYLVDVTDGQLSLRLLPPSNTSVYLDGLTIVPRSFPVEFQFGPGNAAVGAGRDQVSNFTTYNSTLGYGFSAQSGNMYAGSGSPGWVGASSMTFREDLPDGTYLVTPTLLGTGNSGDAVNVYVQGVEVATLPTVSGSVSGSYVAVVSGGYLTLELSGVTADGAAIASLAVLPLQFIANPTLPSSSPGLTPITNGTIYSASTGYGFSPSDTTLGLATGSVTASDMTFLVNLPDGYYDVTLTIGGGESGDQLFLQGSTATTDRVTTPNGASLSQPYLVDVTDGQLSLRLLPPSNTSVYLNGLAIVPRAFPLQFQFAPGGSVPSAGYDAASNFTLYSTQSHYGFTSATQNMNSASGSPGWVYAKDMTFQVDIPNGTYVVTPTLLGTGHSGDGAYVYLQGTEVGTMPAASGAVTDSYTVTVSNGSLTLRLLEMTADGVAISKLTIAPSSQQQDDEVAMSGPMAAKIGRREGPTVAPGTGQVVPVVGAATPSGPGGAAFFYTPSPPAPSASVVVGDAGSGSPRDKSPSITVLTDDDADDLDGIAVFEFETESSPAAPSLPASKKQRGN